MKLYVIDQDNEKQYLDLKSSTRNELAHKLENSIFLINGHQYHVSDVSAEKSSDATPISMVLGGALGLFGGVPGVLIGGALGALLGTDADKKETAEIKEFNRSQS